MTLNKNRNCPSSFSYVQKCTFFLSFKITSSKNIFGSLFSEWFNERSKRNEKRIKRLREICEKYPNETKYENTAHLSKRQFDLEKDLEMMSCSIEKFGPKVRRNFLVPNPFDKWKSRWKKVIFVKEPMERLAWYFYQNQQIGSVLRKNASQQVKNQAKPIVEFSTLK